MFKCLPVYFNTTLRMGMAGTKFSVIIRETQNLKAGAKRA